MLTRRHIRVKVLQSIYAYNQREYPDIDVQEKFLWYSIEQMRDLYLLLLQLLVVLPEHAEGFLTKSQQKYLATDTEKNPSLNFVNNRVLKLIASNPTFSETIKRKKLNYWAMDTEYVNIILNELRDKSWYEDYLNLKETDYKIDQKFVTRLYKEVIAPNDKLYDYLEDKRLTWLDDFPIVNTAIVRMIEKLNEKNAAANLIPELYKYDDDREFAIDLFRKVILNDQKLTQEIEGKTPNWDQDRIAELDMIILKMGICEFLYFPSIPVRVTINEYLEIAKEYSTPKSSIFINGILDKVVKEYQESDTLNKTGRGLM